MDNQFEEDEHARSSRRAQKIEEMKREKERQMQQRERFRKYLPIIGGAVCVVVVIGIGGSAIVRQMFIRDRHQIPHYCKRGKSCNLSQPM